MIYTNNINMFRFYFVTNRAQSCNKCSTIERGSIFLVCFLLMSFVANSVIADQQDEYDQLNQTTRVQSEPSQDPNEPIVHKIRIFLARNFTVFDSSGQVSPQLSYYGAVGVGTPPKLYNVVFDTGSEETWFPSYSWFPLANNLHYQDGYSCKESSTCKASDRKFTIDYRTTTLSGELITDLLTFSEDQFKDEVNLFVSPRMILEQQFLSVDNTEDEQFRFKPYDAVIGLAPVTRANSGIINLLISLQDKLMRHGLTHLITPNPNEFYANPGYPPRKPVLTINNALIFSLWFNPNQNARHGAELIIGGVDDTRFIGAIIFHKVTSWFQWQFRVEHVMLGSQIVSCPHGCYAVLETGVNSLVGPRAAVEAIYAGLNAQPYPGTDLWQVDCNEAERFPYITFRVDAMPHLVGSNHYVRQIRIRDDVVCYLTIKPRDIDDWILGTSFMSAFYTVFDFGSRTIGFGSPY